VNIKSKDYGEHGGVMYNFMLEEAHDYGITSVAKFGHKDKSLVEALHTMLRSSIQQKRRIVSAVLDCVSNILSLPYVFVDESEVDSRWSAM
jgi:hypothetical protein